MDLPSVTPGGKYDLGRTQCADETLRITSMHLFFVSWFTVTAVTTWSKGGTLVREEEFVGEGVPCQGFLQGFPLLLD